VICQTHISAPDTYNPFLFHLDPALLANLLAKPLLAVIRRQRRQRSIGRPPCSKSKRRQSGKSKKRLMRSLPDGWILN
jgi:hypothetical protein